MSRGRWTQARGSTSLAALALLACTASCDDAAAPELSRSSPTETPAVDLQATELSRLADRVAFKRHEVEQRQNTNWELPSKPKDAACGALASGDASADQLIVLAWDARVDTRQLLPLRLLQRMASNDLQELEAHYDASSSAGAKRKLRSVRDGELALEKLSDLAARKYAAVFHITHYVEPRFFHDPKKRKPEWSGGLMMGWLALHELGEPEAMCQWRIDVRGEAGDASLARRLRETTKRELVAALAERFRAAGKRAHVKLASGLTWPRTAH